MLKYASSKVDFNVAEGVYMLPSDMNLRVGNIENFNNKILVSKSGYRIGKNEEINQPIVKAFEGPRKPLPSQGAEEKQPGSSAEEHEEEKQL